MAFTMSYAMIGALFGCALLDSGTWLMLFTVKPHKIYKNKWLEKLEGKIYW